MLDHRLRLLPGAVLLFCAGIASALGIEPIRIELSPARPSQTLTVRNDGDQPRLVQLETFDWQGWDSASQQMALSTSRTLIANPPAFRLAAHASQLIRVGLSEAPGGAMQRGYRILVRELLPLEPQPASGPGQVALLVNFNLPVFYTPDGTPVGAKLEWRGERGVDGRRLLVATNPGAVAVRVAEVQADGVRLSPFGGHNGYLLAGQSLSWGVGDGERRQLNLRIRDDKGQWSNANVALP
ncbi:molecular chaperone [Jeongeupia sp. USM3]|uniref:fimbrial biogenesis chaperone n=1 Tax=Jeongeupia sp. USM3 TaxID=1906741 RepID=UPI00089DF025|nr:fimbria/pilus periplasmic chaperone [Jeongeupia sp. USM3]AOY00350.1 hypothetical protein BJP62_07765 [Jeongeupia sp. USM3]